MNAVLKPQHIETIFDYDVTESELKTLLFGDVENLDEYSEFIDSDSALADISRLFRLRGDNKSADNFIDRISDSQLRTQFKTIPCAEAGRSFAV